MGKLATADGPAEGKRTVENLRPNVDDIFLAALEREGAAERFAYLEEACGANPVLRRRVERLLEAQAKNVSFSEAQGLVVREPNSR